MVGNPRRVCRGVAMVRLDGTGVAAGPVRLLDDGGTHLAELVLGGEDGA